MMRYTEQPNQDVRSVPAGEIWAGIIEAENPYIVLASRLDEEMVGLIRCGPVEAREMGKELIRLANVLAAPNN
jgi:hypothetical protein